MTTRIYDNEQFAKYLSARLGEMQRMGDSFEMLILPVSHVTRYPALEPVIQALPGFTPPLRYGGLDKHLGTISLNLQYTVEDAIAEINIGNVSFDARCAALNNIAELDESDVFEMFLDVGKLPIARKGFAAALKLPLESAGKRTYRLSFCMDQTRDQFFLVVTRGDQEEPNVFYPEDLPVPFLSDLDKCLLSDRLENTTITQCGMHINIGNGRELLRHAEFPLILAHLRPGYSYFVQHWHGAFRLFL